MSSDIKWHYNDNTHLAEIVFQDKRSVLLKDNDADQLNEKLSVMSHEEQQELLFEYSNLAKHFGKRSGS